MGVYYNVDGFDLKGSPQVSRGFSRLKENGGDGDTFYLDWILLDDGEVDLLDGRDEFKSMGDFECDLLFLHELGVRGYIETVSEHHDFCRFELDDEGVKRFVGAVAYCETPEGVVNRESLKL